MATTEDVKILVVEERTPESPRASGATPKTPASQVSPRSKFTSPFMPKAGMDPREVAFWPPQRYDKETVDFSRPAQEWDTPLLLKQVVEHKRPYPLDSVTFREYLCGFYTEENIDFLLELSRIRREIEKDGNPRVRELTEFYEKYMKTSGAKSANISSAALSHVESVLQSGERDLEIRDFHLANRDIADLLIRGPYLKDFFRTNLESTNENENRSDIYWMIIMVILGGAAYTLILKMSYFWAFLAVYATFWFMFMGQKFFTRVCPILSLYHDGYRMRPSAQFWHCMYMNEHLQKIHDTDILESQKKICWRQMYITAFTTTMLPLAFCLIRYFVFEN